MKILAVNPGHNGSACLIEDGKVIFYIEEERLSRFKYDGNPFRAALYALQNHNVDVLVLGGTSSKMYPELTWTGESLFHGFARKFNPKIKIVNLAEYHHLGHAAATFYNSGFDEAACVVVDGCGSMKSRRFGTTSYGGLETESIFKFSYPGSSDLIYQSIADMNGNDHKDDYDFKGGPGVTITKTYEAVTRYLGWAEIEAGKTMGLAPYGSFNPNIPELFDQETGRAKLDLVKPNYPNGAIIRTDTDAGKIFADGNPESTDWHRDPSKCTQIAKDLAWRVQQETQKLVGDLIEKAIDETGLKNICIGGGYGLNCMANYYYRKRFPGVNIYQDPAAHDGGTAIGLAKLVWYRESGSKEKFPLESLYLSVDYSKDEQKKVIDSLDPTKYNVSEATNSDVAKLLFEKNIVALFQGRAEAGPRALGNRSMLYTPLDPNGKDHVNTVKRREWFRPFAGSMLAEHFEDWFETYGLKETPYMMYAMDFKPGKGDEVPSIRHVDGTCRIQTVTKEQNQNYYDLINEFYKLSGVPMVFNTSFNLGGEPLVETPEDAIRTIENSDIKYLYFADVNLIVEKL